ncbi:hypothetical protein PHJA_000279200 [Phtheirospermum japonicum]|uniref:Uncharacterized protein n=1 Tax=Phtheirospermum japonicum TaxID=374723 RepID=A0A830B7V7_9LAMI|nr:hypothetical protein PHJA_000279200 [Phtheirospermum japonicum]
MATLEDDFTFPAAAATDSPPRFIDSPPLWRRPTTAHEKPGKLKGKEAEEFKKSRNFNEDEEEKMDVLWENLNDESSRNGGKIAENRDISSSSPEDGVQIRCAKSLKLSRTNGQMFSGKKPIIFVFIKVVKKVLLMQNSHRIKKQAW